MYTVLPLKTVEANATQATSEETIVIVTYVTLQKYPELCDLDAFFRVLR